jgi:hypothetical protein
LGGKVAETAEEIIKETCKELDIEVIDKPFFKKESFTKETTISAKLARHGWEVVERYISGQKGYGYEKTNTIPVVVTDEEKEKVLKNGYLTLYTKLFEGVVRISKMRCEKKSKSFYIPMAIIYFKSSALVLRYRLRT